MLKNSRTATGVKEIFMPGEIEARQIEERKVTGLDFSDALVAELTDLARQCGALGADGALTDLLA
jgi:LDH2 family malate/lactate/ureidoglycolate dehydrogenase